MSGNATFFVVIIIIIFDYSQNVSLLFQLGIPIIITHIHTSQNCELSLQLCGYNEA